MRRNPHAQSFGADIVERFNAGPQGFLQRFFLLEHRGHAPPDADVRRAIAEATPRYFDATARLHELVSGTGDHQIAGFQARRYLASMKSHLTQHLQDQLKCWLKAKLLATLPRSDFDNKAARRAVCRHIDDEKRLSRYDFYHELETWRSRIGNIFSGFHRVVFLCHVLSCYWLYLKEFVFFVDIFRGAFTGRAE